MIFPVPKVKADFEPVSTLVLAYPLGMSERGFDYDVLVPFYDKLINLVPDSVKIVLLATKMPDISFIKDVSVQVVPGLNTIWLRDCAGFNCGDTLVKPLYRPSYYADAWADAVSTDQTTEVMAAILGKKLVRMPLALDGGNLVTNGEFALITERVFKDNPTMSKGEIAASINSYLGIIPIFIPELDDDETAHSDGYVQFVRSWLACVSEYGMFEKFDPLKQGYDLADHYTGYIECVLRDHNIQIANLSDECTGDDNSSGFESAAGCFVNFLQLNEIIIMPTYSGMEESEKYNEAVLSKFGTVNKINCDAVAALGGALHCISFTD